MDDRFALQWSYSTQQCFVEPLSHMLVTNWAHYENDLCSSWVPLMLGTREECEEEAKRVREVLRARRGED